MNNFSHTRASFTFLRSPHYNIVEPRQLQVPALYSEISVRRDGCVIFGRGIPLLCSCSKQMCQCRTSNEVPLYVLSGTALRQAYNLPTLVIGWITRTSTRSHDPFSLQPDSQIEQRIATLGSNCVILTENNSLHILRSCQHHSSHVQITCTTRPSWS